MNHCGNDESIEKIHGKSGIVNYAICEVLSERYAWTWIMPHQDIVEDVKKELTITTTLALHISGCGALHISGYGGSQFTFQTCCIWSSPRLSLKGYILLKSMMFQILTYLLVLSCHCMLMIIYTAVLLLLLTLGAHAQRGYCSWVCLSVCLFVCYSISHLSNVCSSQKRYRLPNGQ